MISFIIIGRNEGWRLKKCFDSIYSVIVKDEILDYEIIYVDSKSTDGSLTLAKSYTGIDVFLITGECNAAIARNIGAKEASGDILFFIDGDMEIQPGFLKLVIDPNIGQLSYPFVSGVWNNIIYNKYWEYSYTDERDNNAVDRVEQTTGGLFIINAYLWNRVGGMDNRLKRHQDLDFGFRLFRLGYPLHRKKELLALHHTIPYANRATASLYYKYTGLLLRKHLFSKLAIRILLYNQYTSLLLLLLIIFSLYGWYWFFVPYLVAVFYRSIKLSMKEKNRVFFALLRNIKFVIARDIIFVFSIFAYYPSMPIMQYSKL